MQIKDFLPSSIVIANIMLSAPNDTLNKSIGTGRVLMEMMNHSSNNLNMFAAVYVKGVASGLFYNSFIVDWMADANPEFKRQVKRGALLQTPQPVDWLEISDVVYQFMLNHPEVLELPSVMLIENALHDVYGGIDDEDE